MPRAANGMVIEGGSRQVTASAAEGGMLSEQKQKYIW